MSHLIEQLDSRVMLSSAHFVFETQPLGGVAGVRQPIVRIEVQDPSYNPLALRRVTISASYISNSAKVTTHNVLKVTDGIIAVPRPPLKRAGDYVLKLTASGVNTATSSTFTIAPAPAVRMKLDRFGNLATNDASFIVKLSETGGDTGFWNTNLANPWVDSVVWINGPDDAEVTVIGGVAQFDITGDGSGAAMTVRLGDTNKRLHALTTPTFRLGKF